MQMEKVDNIKKGEPADLDSWTSRRKVTNHKPALKKQIHP